MQFVFFSALLVLASASSAKPKTTPVTQVVKLINDLRAKIETDGKNELKAYDKYACFCEDTLQKKTAEISAGKASIDSLQKLITGLGGELATHDVEINQLKKDLADNREAQRNAKALRNKEYNAYAAERTEAEQGIGSMEAAIKTMTGAGASKTKFLQTLQEAQMLSTLGPLRAVLEMPVLAKTVSAKDLDLVRKFIDRPDDFSAPSASMSAMQVGNNPAGDYAPASTQIQGILKGMYDSFTHELEKDNAEESNKQKAFEELMATKNLEEQTLKATLERQEGDEAFKTKQEADSRGQLDDTKELLEANEKFFAQTKNACKEKAAAWSERTRLRVEELKGMEAAVDILTGSYADSSFKKATTAFLQTSAKQTHTFNRQAAEHLQNLAGTYGSLALTQIAAEVRLGGHFDHVIHEVQNMIAQLKAEGQQDIDHRDRCEQAQKENKHKMEDLNFDIDKLKDHIGRLEEVAKELNAKIKKAEKDIQTSSDTIKAMSTQRSEEQAAFEKAKQDDLDAASLIQKAIASLSKFYKDNGIKMTNLLEDTSSKAPDTWEEDEYGGQKSASTGILAILSMIQEDLEKEVARGERDNEVAIENFWSDRKDVEEAMDAQKQTKLDSKSELADISRQISFAKDDKSDLNNDLDNEKDTKKAIAKDCDWIKTDFKKRAEKRKLEMAGQAEAISFLKGASAPPAR